MKSRRLECEEAPRMQLARGASSPREAEELKEPQASTPQILIFTFFRTYAVAHFQTGAPAMLGLFFFLASSNHTEVF
jgi:hypothetical protein